MKDWLMGVISFGILFAAMSAWLGRWGMFAIGASIVLIFGIALMDVHTRDEVARRLEKK